MCAVPVLYTIMQGLTDFENYAVILLRLEFTEVSRYLLNNYTCEVVSDDKPVN